MAQKRHSAAYNSARKAIIAKYPGMSEKAVNIRAYHAVMKKAPAAAEA